MSSGRGPSVVSRLRRLLQVAILLFVAVSALAYVLVPSVKDAINSGVATVTGQIQHIVNPKLDPIRPTSEMASDQLPGHPVSQMFDKYANTDWRANGASPSVTLTFDHKFDLGALIVHAGAADNFTATRRPSQLLLTFSDGSSTTINLKDDNTAQTVNVDKAGITGFVVTVVATNGPANQPVVISELEVFAKD
jgi:hypothetical protein